MSGFLYTYTLVMMFSTHGEVEYYSSHISLNVNSSDVKADTQEQTLCPEARKATTYICACLYMSTYSCFS